jgi:COP9 signalosome complex subunit 1
MGNEDLGNHYFIMGEYNNAQKCYTRMRESCTTSKHIVEMNLKLLNVAIAHKNWSHAVTFGVKITSLGIKAEDRVAKFDPLINATTGLAHLNLGHYKDAAELFLAVNPTYMALEPLASIEFQKEVISPNDIAIYGGLCALATYDSAELKKHVLENQPFRQFLELESHLRRAISMFCGSKFSACLAVLDSYAADYKLDLYLQSHFAKLYQRIRTKSLVQWLSAFSCVTFQEIQKAFPAPDQTSLGSKKQPYSLLAELEDLIKSGSLNARIDMADEVSSIAFIHQNLR